MEAAILLSWAVGCVLLLVWAGVAVRRERRRRIASDAKLKQMAAEMIYTFNDDKSKALAAAGARCICLDHLPVAQQWGRVTPCKCGYRTVRA